MEPWQQEALRQERPLAFRRCQCCGRPIQSEWYLDLEPFGLLAAACEGCVERNLRGNERRGNE